MDIQFVGQPFGLGRRVGLVERGRRVGVELIWHQHEALGVREVLIDQVANALGEVDPGAPIAEGDVTPSSQSFADKKVVNHAVARILRVAPRGKSWGSLLRTILPLRRAVAWRVFEKSFSPPWRA